MTKTKDFNASERLRAVVKHMQDEHYEITGKKLKIKDFLKKYFRPNQDDSFLRWRNDYDRFPDTILKELDVLKEAGINTPDYFRLMDAPMLIGDDPNELIRKDTIKEIVKEASNEELLKVLIEKIEVLSDLQKKTNQLLKENNDLRRP